ncbi:MAG: hypothetical protein QOE03_1100, partial [Micromonosporaceae bacterium]|nr:hypothetical protein [Micromonosporaceae bacterium]
MTTAEAPTTAEWGGHDALTADGRIVRIRPATASDAAALRDLYERVSDRSIYLRFFYTPGPDRIDQEVRRLVRPAAIDHLALVAVEGDALIGMASYERCGTGVDAEFAVLVADTEHGRGVGTLLLEDLIQRARRHGIRELRGDVLMDNAPMMRVAHDLTPTVSSHLASGIAEVRVSTAVDEATLAASDMRERHAERQALRAVLAPASIAVVGAGRSPGGVGHEVLINLIDHGFTGPVYPVNPHATEVGGRPAYRRLIDLPDRVDLAVIAVPAGAVADVLADAAAAGVRAVVVLTAGLGEAGDDGRTIQSQLVDFARCHDIRLVGPNCLGVINTDPSVRLAATFSTTVPPAGGLAVASQSGAVGIAVL